MKHLGLSRILFSACVHVTNADPELFLPYATYGNVVGVHLLHLLHRHSITNYTVQDIDNNQIFVENGKWYSTVPTSF